MKRGVLTLHWHDLHDVDSVAGHLVTRAAALFDSSRVLLYLLDEGGEKLIAWDAVGPRAERRSVLSAVIEIGGDESLPCRVVREGRILLAPPGVGAPIPGWDSRTGVAGVPLQGKGGAIGALLVATDAAGEEAENRLAELAGMTRDAAEVLERIRLERDGALAADRLARLLEHQKRIGAANRLDEIMRMASKAAGEGVRASFTAVWRLDGPEEPPRAIATFGAPGLDPDGRLAAMTKRIEEAIASRTVIRGRLGEGDGIAFLAAPMTAFDEIHGAIACVEKSAASRLDSRWFSAEDEAYLSLLALQVAMAAENARLGDRLRRGESALREAQQAALRHERGVAVGEMARGFLEEARAPVQAILAAAERLERGIAVDDPLHDAAAVVLREGRRLDEGIGEQIAFGRHPSPRLAIIQLPELVREALEPIRSHLENRGVRLIEVLEGRVPPMLLDRERVLHLLSNILSSAAEAVRAGQRIRVRTRAAEGWAQVEIAHDGESLPGEIADRLFVPFGSAGRPGGGLGLGIADQILREHGGEIRVRSDAEWSAVFTVSLPIRTNQDRRRSKDRRGGRDRRRVA